MCYFLWDRGYEGPCEVESHHAGVVGTSTRFLNEFDLFVRHSAGVPILRKVLHGGFETMRKEVSPVRPFGISSKMRPQGTGSLTLISSGGEGLVSGSIVTDGDEFVDCWKVLLSSTSHDHGGQADKDGARRVFSRVRVIGPKVVCTESYIVIGKFATEEEAENCKSYLLTKFVRFLVALVSYSHHVTGPRFEYVPWQDFNRGWDDQSLYEMYDLTEGEVEVIESMIRPMERADD